MTTGRGASKQAVWEAASSLFAEQGYANTSVRDIAARASVDPALVIRHYGTKERLFLETMLAADGEVVRFDGPIETLGESIVRFVLDTHSSVSSTYLALIRASDSGEVGSALRSTHEAEFVAPLLEHLEGPRREERARLVAAMVGGLMYSLWIVGDEELLRADPEQLVALYAPAMQGLITPRQEA